jgi:hypothetical protein
LYKWVSLLNRNSMKVVFFSNMLVKIDQVCFIFYDLVDFFIFETDFWVV